MYIKIFASDSELFITVSILNSLSLRASKNLSTAPLFTVDLMNLDDGVCVRAHALIQLFWIKNTKKATKCKNLS